MDFFGISGTSIIASEEKIFFADAPHGEHRTSVRATVGSTLNFFIFLRRLQLFFVKKITDPGLYGNQKSQRTTFYHRLQKSSVDDFLISEKPTIISFLSFAFGVTGLRSLTMLAFEHFYRKSTDFFYACGYFQHGLFENADLASPNEKVGFSKVKPPSLMKNKSAFSKIKYPLSIKMKIAHHRFKKNFRIAPALSLHGF